MKSLYDANKFVVFFGVLCIVAFYANLSYAQPQKDSEERRVSVHLQEAFDAKVSVIPFVGAIAQYEHPVGDVSGVKSGESATINVPFSLLPGEFLLRLDYRSQETDHPYPAERVIFINKQDIELTVNPPYINNDERTHFNKGEQENTVYSAFMKENAQKRMPVDSLRQFLLSYDRPKSKVYAQAAKEFEQRRKEYNAWLNSQTKQYKKLFVSRLFQFQYISKMTWSGDEKENIKQMLGHYFEGIDFSDPLIIRSRELARFMDVYMRMSGMQEEDEEKRAAVFVQAGRMACEAAVDAHPDVYDWMVDYLQKGYEKEGISDGLSMLEGINGKR